MKTIKNFIAFLGVAVALALSVSAQTSLTSTDGAKVDVQAQRGKVVILAVGASWLPLSGKQAEFTNTLAKRYAGKDVVVYFVATDSSAAKSKNFASNADIAKFASANKLSPTILRDPDGIVMLKQFSIDQLPSFIILDKDGRQSGDAFGGIDPKYDVTLPISKAVDKLL